MMKRAAIHQSRAAILLATCLLGSSQSGASTENSSRAAPEIMIFYGGPLASRIVFPDVAENHRFLAATSPVARAFDPDGRSEIPAALFWGIQWRPYARNPLSWPDLDPKQANQHAVFYPAIRDGEALLMIRGSPGRRSLRAIETEGLRILSEHGVPIQLSR
jgi:hypothetical protein